jgi:hypothetical protein
MAEVVGTIASGIGIATLALNIAQSVGQLKGFWDEVRDAPADIRDLLDEVEDLCLLLADIEAHQDKNPIVCMVLSRPAMARSLERCRHCARRLRELAEELGADLEGRDGLRRRWAAGKVVLKKEKIERYRARLSNAVKMLSFSHQYYTKLVVPPAGSGVEIWADGFQVFCYKCNPISLLRECLRPSTLYKLPAMQLLPKALRM